MGVMKRLYELRKLGRVDEPRWRPIVWKVREMTPRLRRPEAERVYRRSKAVQMRMFEED